MNPLPSTPLPPAARRGAGFTLIELLVVISIIAVLAGMLVGLAPQVTVRMKEARTRAELEKLVTAIETYRGRHGVYPPDNVMGRGSDGTPIVNSVTNALFYELTGLMVVRTKGGGYFVPVGDGDRAQTRLDPTLVLQYFNRDGFVNAATTNNLRRLYHHDFKDSQHASITRAPTQAPTTAPNVEVLTAPIPWPFKDARFPSPVAKPGFETVNPWRYVSSNPTNNPATFDLWAEVIIRGQRRVIGNWKN